MHSFIEVLGWYGTVSIILAYALLSFFSLTSTNFIYQLLNLTGALGIVVHSFYRKDFQPGVLNLIWTVIALIAIIKIF